jgi:hypothetical protein
MKTLKALLEDVRAFNLDTDEELDLDALADLDLDSLLGGEYSDDGSDVSGLDFSSLADMSLDDEPLEFGDEAMDLESLGDDAINDAGLDGEENPEDMAFDVGDEVLNSDEEEKDFDNMSQNQADDIADGDPDAEDQNADFQGEIRTVRGANLVFKRKMDDGNFEELWIYNVGNDIKRETQIRRAILAGTDIDPGAQESKDGQQRADTSTTGNVQFLHIVGLPQ